MLLGNLNSVFENEQTIMEAVQSNILTQNSLNNSAKYAYAQKPSRFAKILTSLSHYGMNYDDQVYKNMMAIPADKALQPKDDLYANTSLYGGMMNNWQVKGEEDKTFREKTIEQKREVLRKMSMQPELENILDKMANASIVYDDNEAYICTPFIDTALTQNLTEDFSRELNNAIDTSFYKIYLLLNWKTSAWDDYKRWLIDGVLAYEIIYDNIENPHTIIGVVDIDPATLTRQVDVKTNTIYWVQFKDVLGKERTLLDSQIIYIKYEDSGVSTRQSYLERLIRPFNLYRIIEQAQVIWTVTQSSFKTMWTIPVNGMNKAKGMQTLNQAMNRYREDINFNVETGELKVNDKVNLPFVQEYFLPENENGTPTVQTIVDSGPMLNDSDQIKFFESKLYKMSNIPENRFDKESQSTWFGSDPTQALHDEIEFSRFVDRMRNSFAMIMLKPLKIQLTLQIPEIKNDKRILDAVSLRFNSYNPFEEMMRLEIDAKRAESIQTLQGITVQDAEGNEEAYFCPEFLIIKYMKMSEADLELNEKLKRKAKLKKDAESGGDSENDEEGGADTESSDSLLGGNEEGGSDDNGGSESDEGGEVDSEMMGDVQPESTETTQV